MKTIKHYVDKNGNSLGDFEGSVPENGIEVPVRPNTGLDIWNGKSWDAAKLTKKQKADALKFSGIKFDGVLCSAEAEDMWGLSSIKEFIKAGNSTPFVFNNGNTLLLTPDNLSSFEAVWVPFRLGFFK
jgi:hypothetical protein